MQSVGGKKDMNHFDKYVNLIRKVANKTAAKYRIDYEDVEAEGYLIYVECLGRHDPTKSSFSTYLTIELTGRLERYAYSVFKHNLHAEASVDDEESNVQLESSYSTASMQRVLDYAVDSLSSPAYRVFEWILGRTWEREGKRKPSLTDALNAFGFTKNEGRRIWDEIGAFYRKDLSSSFQTL